MPGNCWYFYLLRNPFETTVASNFMYEYMLTKEDGTAFSLGCVLVTLETTGSTKLSTSNRVYHKDL